MTSLRVQQPPPHASYHLFIFHLKENMHFNVQYKKLMLIVTDLPSVNQAKEVELDNFFQERKN